MGKAPVKRILAVRKFTDRTEPKEAFNRIFNDAQRNTDEFNVISYYGIGGFGKTRLINLYSINDALMLVDLPGYGFAKAPKAQRDSWAQMIEGYLRDSENLRHVFCLVDIRHEPGENDRMMVEYLRHYDIPFTVVATKADKLSRAAQNRSVPVICRTLGVQPWEVIVCSAEDGTGREKLLDMMERLADQGAEA